MKLKSIEEWVPLLKRMPRIGEILRAKNKISQEQLEMALKQKEIQSDVPLGKLLVANGDIQENDLLSIFSEFLGISYIPSLSIRYLEEHELAITYETYSFLYGMFPLSSLEADEFLFYRSDIVKTENGFEWHVYCFVNDPWHYQKIMNRFRDRAMRYSLPEYQDTQFGEISKVSKTFIYVTLAKRGDILRLIEDLKEYQHRTTLRSEVTTTSRNMSLFWEMTNSAIQMKCSDIHISLNNIYGGLNVRFRKDGILETESRFSFGSEKFPLSAYDEFTNIILNEAGMISHEKNVRPQDGSIQYPVEGEAYDMRIASVPMFLEQRYMSPKLTIRILYKNKM